MERPFTSRVGKRHALGKETHQIPSLFQIFPCCLRSAVTACTAVDGQTSSLPLPQCFSPQTCKRAVNCPLSFNSSFPYLTAWVAILRLWGFSKSPSRGLKHHLNSPPLASHAPHSPMLGSQRLLQPAQSAPGPQQHPNPGSLEGLPAPGTTRWVFVCLPFSFERSFHRNRQDSSPLQRGSGALPSVKARSCTALSSSCSHIPPALARQCCQSIAGPLGHGDNGTTALSPRPWDPARAGDVPPRGVCSLSFTHSVGMLRSSAISDMVETCPMCRVSTLLPC